MGEMIDVAGRMNVQGRNTPVAGAGRCVEGLDMCEERWTRRSFLLPA